MVYNTKFDTLYNNAPRIRMERKRIVIVLTGRDINIFIVFSFWIDIIFIVFYFIIITFSLHFFTFKINLFPVYLVCFDKILYLMIFFFFTWRITYISLLYYTGAVNNNLKSWVLYVVPWRTWDIVSRWWSVSASGSFGKFEKTIDPLCICEIKNV